MQKNQKILILINESQNYRPFFANIGRYLSAQGHTVTFALTNRYTDYLYPDDVLPETSKTAYLTDYFYNNWGKLLPEKYKKYNVWLSLFPDFERFEYFHLHKEKKAQYFEELVSTSYCFFDSLFNEYKFDVVLFESVSNLFGFAAFHAAKEYGAEFLSIGSSRLPGRFEILRTVFDESSRMQEYDEKDTGKGVEFEDEIEEILHTFCESMPDYMRKNAFDPKISLRAYFSFLRCRQIFRIFRYSLSQKWELSFCYQTGNPILFSVKMFMRSLRRKYILSCIQKYYEKNLKFDRPFFLYPIHLHPESSTSVLAWQYIDEMETIKKIAFSLPPGYLLLVKDHKSAAGFPTKNFYRNIVRIPNVRLVHYNENTKEIIKKSQGVITSTSTVGFESLILGKPVYLLGRVFYEKHPLVTQISNFDDLRFHLGRLNERDDSVKFNAKKFLSSYLSYTFPGTLMIEANEPSLEILKIINEQVMKI